MGKKTNSITWITRKANQATKAKVSRATLLHSRGQREADRITVVFDSGPYRHRMALERQEDGRFEGVCERLGRESEQRIDARAVRCLLLDSLQGSALLMGLTPWIDDNQGEADWMAHFKNVQRVICAATEGTQESNE